MKGILTLALLCSLTLFACSKNGDSDDDPKPNGGTAVNFENNLSRPLSKVLVGLYLGSSVKLLKNYGTLAAGASTGDIAFTPEGDLMKIFFYYEEDDKVYYTTHGFLLDKGQKKTYNIMNNTSFDRIEKTSFMYPK